MSLLQCLRRPAPVRQVLRQLKTSQLSCAPPKRGIKTVPPAKISIDQLLSKPTWSVRSLLPRDSDATPQLAPSQLRHLLRLSALPQPATSDEEAKMLETLQSQLHFVREIQSVDATGVEPLQAIRDETEEATKENIIGLETLKEALANEEVKGRNRRPRRRRDTKVDIERTEEWNVLGTASRTVGKYFVVNTSKSDTQ